MHRPQRNGNLQPTQNQSAYDSDPFYEDQEDFGSVSGTESLHADLFSSSSPAYMRKSIPADWLDMPDDPSFGGYASGYTRESSSPQPSDSADTSDAPMNTAGGAATSESSPAPSPEPRQKSKRDSYFELQSVMKGQSLNELTTFRNALDTLETMIRQGKRIPVGNMIAVDSIQIFQLMEELNRAAPGVIETARGVMNQREELLSDAKKKAEAALKEIEDERKKIEDYRKQTEKMFTQKKDNLMAELQSRVDSATAQTNAEADEIIRQAKQQGQLMIDAAEQKARRMMSDQEILARANLQAEELKQQTQEDVNKLYDAVYSQLDTMLDVVDRTYSQHLNDIRVMRQQIHQNME